MIELVFFRPRSHDPFTRRRWPFVPPVGSTVQLDGVRYVVQDLSLGDFLRRDGSPFDGRCIVAVNVLTERELLGRGELEPMKVCEEALDETLATVRAYLSAGPTALETQLTESLAMILRGIVAGACVKTLRATIGAIEGGGLHELASRLEAIEADGFARRKQPETEAP